MHDGLPEAVERKLDPVQRYGLRLTLFAVAILLVAVPFGVLLGQVITDGPATAWDSDIAEWLHEQVAGHTVVIAILEVISFLGKPIFLFFLIGIPVAWLAYRSRWHLVMFLVVTSIGAGIVDTLVKEMVARPRPLLDDPITSARATASRRVTRCRPPPATARCCWCSPPCSTTADDARRPPPSGS